MWHLEHQAHVSSAGEAGGPIAEDADAFLARLEASYRAGARALGDLEAAALEALAVACARGGGAHELAVGEGLELLARSGGDVRLGFSCVGDLARERLGIAPWQVRRLRRNAVALRTRPLLREAVRSGEVTARKAEVVLAVATGADEAYWVERAKVDTVRRLEAAVSCPGELEEDWHLLRLSLSRTQAELVDYALTVAKLTLGPTAGVWRQLWALAVEFLGSFSSEPLDALGASGPWSGPGPGSASGSGSGSGSGPWSEPGTGSGTGPGSASDSRAGSESASAAGSEAEAASTSASGPGPGAVSRRAAAAAAAARGAALGANRAVLTAVPPSSRSVIDREREPAKPGETSQPLPSSSSSSSPSPSFSSPSSPGSPSPSTARGPGAGSGSGPFPKAPAPDPYDLLERLARLVADRAAADERLGRACLLVKRLAVARQLGWSCFDEWCVERLGLAPSTVYQRMALERRMVALPELREALRTRRLSYEQARLVARVATPSDVAARIADAAGKSCIALVRELEAEARLQMCDAGELRAVVPEEVESLLSDAIRAARLHAGRPLTAGEALCEIARHFLETWAAEALRLLKAAHPTILRDEGLCQIPGCSRAAAHRHHLWFRSAGGPLQPWNELSACIPHHLPGIHGGKVLAIGRAPDGVTFVLGEREVAAARARSRGPG